MDKFLRIGFFSVALAQSLYAVDATNWWELDEQNVTNPPAPGTQIPLSDPLTIFENSTLNITANGNGNLGGQWFNGSVNFDHNLAITLDAQAQGTNQTTTIYRLNNGGLRKTFGGTGSLTLNIDAQNVFAKSIFNFDGAGDGLDINVKLNITATENSQIFSIFRVGSNSSLNITNDFIVDLSKATGTLNNANIQEGITGVKAIFDAGGNINVNQNGNALVQMTGDIANFSGTTTINLTNSDSFFKGRVEAVNNSTTNFNLSNGALAEISLTSHNRNGTPTFTINLNSGSTAKINTLINSAASRLTYNINNASLYADFTYNNPNDPDTPADALNNPAQATVNVSNSGTWFVSKTNTIDALTIGNPEDNLTRDNFENLTNLASVDFRFTNNGATLRAVEIMDETSRFILKTNSIGSTDGLAGGVFRLYGVFNTAGWTEVRDANNGNILQETIATDQIQTGQLNGTHHIQLFWDQNSFDKSLINTNLEEKKIIVAKQYNQTGGSNFIGAVTPIGVYNYITNLKKETFTWTDNNGANITGTQWIVADVQRADNSYLSRLLDSIFQTQFRIYKTQIDTLNLRMGELRKLNRVHGVWLRSKYGRLGSKETEQTIASWDEYASIWLGYDQNFFVLGGKNFLGGSFDVNFFNSNGIPDEDDFSNPSYVGQSQSYGFSVYDTFFFDNGFYIDALAKYYFTHNKFIINSEVLERNTPKFFSHNFYAQLEVGKSFRLPLNFYIKPDAGFSFAFSSGQDWNFIDWSNQLVKARLDFNAPVSMRTGLTAGWTYNSRGYEGDLYIGTSFEYDFNTGGDLRLEDFLDKMTLTHKGNFNWRINAGTNVILNEYWRIYFDVDTAFFGTINSTFTLNAGVRINFGRLHPQMPYIPPYMDMSEEGFGNYPKWRRTIPEVQNYETEGILENYSGKKKRRVYKPKVKIQQKSFEGTQKSQPQQIEQLQVTPQVEQKPTGAPEFIDNPTQINPPSQNYKRDTNVPMYQNSNPAQNQRSMDEIRENYNRGYR